MDKEKKKIDIFTYRSEDWWNNACLNFMEGKNTWYGYFRGYQRAAELLVQYVDCEKQYQDTLVFPIIFLYRHYLELILKDIIYSTSLVLRKETKIKSHSLMHLWDIVKRDAELALNEKIDPIDVENILVVIKQISEIDRSSDSFRYPIYVDGNPSLQGIKYINLMHFKECIDSVYVVLESISVAVSDALDYITNNSQ